MSSDRSSRRIAREESTLAVMIAMYCRDHHGEAERGVDGLCRECAALLGSARLRLERCRYGREKPTCERCPTHCFRPELRAQVRDAMRHSGPRMLREHPVLALRHLIDGRRKTPGRG